VKRLDNSEQAFIASSASGLLPSIYVRPQVELQALQEALAQALRRLEAEAEAEAQGGSAVGGARGRDVLQVGPACMHGSVFTCFIHG
jgi:hypothetical protein